MKRIIIDYIIPGLLILILIGILSSITIFAIIALQHLKNSEDVFIILRNENRENIYGYKFKCGQTKRENDAND